MGFENTDFSDENLATTRATVTAFRAAAMAELPANDKVVSEDRTVPGPDGRRAN